MKKTKVKNKPGREAICPSFATKPMSKHFPLQKNTRITSSLVRSQRKKQKQRQRQRQSKSRHRLGGKLGEVQLLNKKKVRKEKKKRTKGDDPVVAVEKRGFGKARKFSRMMQAGSIPEDIRRLYEEGSKTAKSPRLFKTELINRMFTVGKDGTYVLCTDSPEFKSWRRNVDTRFATAESVGVPYSIMLWQIFQGNEQAMLQAERKGDIYESEGMVPP